VRESPSAARCRGRASLKAAPENLLTMQARTAAQWRQMSKLSRQRSRLKPPSSEQSIRGHPGRCCVVPSRHRGGNRVAPPHNRLPVFGQEHRGNPQVVCPPRCAPCGAHGGMHQTWAHTEACANRPTRRAPNGHSHVGGNKTGDPTANVTFRTGAATLVNWLFLFCSDCSSAAL
jgi:hypothetical protein